MEDLNDIAKVRNFYDIMGYIGYTSDKPEDRKKLYITGVNPLRKYVGDSYTNGRESRRGHVLHRMGLQSSIPI